MWPECEVLTKPTNVRSWGNTGKHVLTVSLSHFDPERTLIEVAASQTVMPVVCIDDRAIGNGRTRTGRNALRAACHSHAEFG